MLVLENRSCYECDVSCCTRWFSSDFLYVLLHFGYSTLSFTTKRFENFGVKVQNLMEKHLQRKNFYQKGLENGDIKVVIGTHSLLDIKTEI